MQEKMMPFNAQAEEGILSSIMIDPNSIEDVMDVLSPADFYSDKHRLIYSALLSLTRQQIVPDSLTLTDELERTGKLEDVGGTYYVFSLTNFEVSAMHIGHYANIVMRDAQCRRIIHVATQMVALAYEKDDKIVEKSEDLLYQVNRKTTRTNFTSMTDLMNSYMTELDLLHTHKGKIIGVPTGYADMDRLLCGLQKTDLLILAGRPGSGKTSLAMNIVRNAAQENNNGVAVFSLEMGERQLARRLMSMESGVDLQSLRSGWIDDDQWDPITRSMNNLSALNIWINDASGNPIASMRSQLRRLLQQTKIDLVVVDYLQLVDPTEEGKSNKNRADEISEISRGLKRIAKEFNVPVLALAQLSRETERRSNKRPQLSDLKESGGIEENADVVMFVYREDYYAAMEKRENYTPTNIAEIIVGKHRNGEVGDISLYFKADQTKFFNLEALLESGR